MVQKKSDGSCYQLVCDAIVAITTKLSTNTISEVTYISIVQYIYL